MNKSKVIRATCIFEHDEEINLTTCLYIPEGKKEKDMKETNLQHYKEGLKEILKINFDNPRGTIRNIREKFGCQIEVKRGEYATDVLLEWMEQPYKEPILDDKEREYLLAVIKPFRNKVSCISKQKNFDKLMEFIHIDLSDGDVADFPNFKVGTMYTGMEVDKYYTLEELGL